MSPSNENAPPQMETFLSISIYTAVGWPQWNMPPEHPYREDFRYKKLKLNTLHINQKLVLWIFLLIKYLIFSFSSDMRLILALNNQQNYWKILEENKIFIDIIKRHVK